MAATKEAVVIGAGMSGCIAARELAERGGYRVTIYEKRDKIGGFCHDYVNEAGIRIHENGPHIFHTKIERSWKYLSRFTGWIKYHHLVMANVNGKFIPVPFNFNSIRAVWEPEKAERLCKKLLDAYGQDAQVPILKLREADDPELQEVATWVYENVFKYYTQKQWGKKPEEVDFAVTARIPVTLSDVDGYFTDPYEGMPSDGYAAIFTRIVNHPMISVKLSARSEDVLKLEGDTIFIEGKPFSGLVVYTAPIDELFGSDAGALPYRAVRFEFETLQQDSFQPAPAINYTLSELFTRISEYKKFTGLSPPGVTTIAKEFSETYNPAGVLFPSYPVSNPESQALHASYLARAQKFGNLHILGRLGSFKYLNMDLAIDLVLTWAEKILATPA